MSTLGQNGSPSPQATEQRDPRRAKWGFFSFLVICVVSAVFFTAFIAGPGNPRESPVYFGGTLFVVSSIGVPLSLLFMSIPNSRRFGTGMLAACGVLLLLGLAVCGVGR